MSHQQSFTLIELMTVVGIIAILAGLMLVGYNIFFSEANIGSSMRFDSSIHHSLGYALVGDWKLDDNAANSTVVDTSGNSNDGTFYSNGSEDNTANHSVDGANGRALDFDGVDDYVYFSNPPSLNEFNKLTVTAWIKPRSFPSFARIVEKNIWDAGSFVLMVYSDNPQIQFGVSNQEDNRKTVTMNSEVPLNKWAYIVGSWDKEQMKIYFNGREDATPVDQSGFISSTKGVRISDNSSTFDGYIDQVRVYKDALSTSQVKQQYYTGLQRLYKKGLITREEYIKRVVQK